MLQEKAQAKQARDKEQDEWIYEPSSPRVSSPLPLAGPGGLSLATSG